VPPTLVFCLFAVVAACNLLTGANDLGPCESNACGAPEELTVDGASTIDDGVGSDRRGDPREVGAEGAARDGARDGSDATEGGSSCPACDGSICCAPNTCVVATGICGDCSAANRPCQLDSDCCSGLKCSTTGRCVSSCRANGDNCTLGTCCLGLTCSLLAGYQCSACQLAGASCNDNFSCCSNSCVNNVCVGNVNPSSLPGSSSGM
jgi:hypothetical protein